MASILDRIENFPPFVCRLLARKHRGRVGMSHEDIAKASGLARSTVISISFRRTWVGIPIETVDRFSAACGVDFFCTKDQRKFLRKYPKGYVYKAPPSQRAMYGRLFELLREWLKSKPTGSMGRSPAA